MTVARHNSTGFAAQDVGIDDAAFKRLSVILRSESGIVLSESKKSLAVSRLSRRLRELKLPDFTSYADLLESDAGEAERREMIYLLTTNVTNFFRESHHFDFLKNDILPSVLKGGRTGERLRIWSAGCSSGQEPYSIAMSVLEAIPDIHRYDARILATDIDANMVRTARAGIYRDLEKTQVSSERRARFFEKQKESTAWKVVEAVQKLITFEELNLIRDWPMRGPFDVIFCRNVVIYFDSGTQEALWSRFSKMLSPGGHLFVGHSERVSGPAAKTMKLVGTTLYKKN